MKRSLLLVSNSVQHGSGYLDHCADEITSFLGGIQSVLFVPYALHDHDGYERVVAQRFAAMDVTLSSIHHAGNPVEAINSAPALFIGGGNTFRLLKTLYDQSLIEPIRARVAAGMKYIGTSAGSNVACVSIKTTNDMPIVYPPSFDALGLVPFNINPHYLDPDPSSTHKGETREQRIREFHEENTPNVVGLREGCMLRIENDDIRLKGTTDARIFRQGVEPQEYHPGDEVGFLLTDAR